MKEHPILFSTEMVQALLREDNPKTQTRRVVKANVNDYEVAYQDGKGDWIFWNRDDKGLAEFTIKAYPNGGGIKCPYGQVGDRLWVRETWAEGMNVPIPAIYKADKMWQDVKIKWKPSIFMPRWASRITLEITDIRVEKLQEITFYDAVREGMKEGCGPETGYSVNLYKKLWDSINGKKHSWESNPFVWVISFKRI